MKLPQFSPRATWTAPAVSSLPSWADAKRICVDVETCDPDLKKMGPGVRTNGYVTGIGFAIEDGPAAYLPIRHAGGGNLNEAQVWQYLADQAAATKATIVHANGQYDHDYLLEDGVDLLHCPWFDVQIADPLLYELHLRYSLDHIAERWDIPGKDETALKAWAASYGINTKSDMWRLPAAAVGPYAIQDVRLPLQLARLQEKAIKKEDLEEIFQVESKLQKVLLKMRRWGVRVDVDRIQVVREMAQRKETELLAEITRRTGVRVDSTDINKSPSWAQVLKNVGIDVPLTAKGAPSVTTEILAAINHPVAALIRETKKYNKLHGTFCDSAERFAVKGRIHCTFNQLRTSKDDGSEEEDGAKYGRLSCVNPNLQQTPSPDKDPIIGKAIRNIFLPDEGAEWVCADFSSQEPRWLVHYAELIGAPKAKEAADRYRAAPNMDYHGMMAELIDSSWPGIQDSKQKKRKRGEAKQIFLGKCYGMGGAKLCHKLDLPTKWIVRYDNKWLQRDTVEGEAALASGGFAIEVAGGAGSDLLKKFEQGVPFVAELEKKAERQAILNGYITTVGGRKCHFPKLSSPRWNKKQNLECWYDWTHKALNRLIQGSAGDQMKKAMVDLDEAGLTPQLQLHDEVDRSIFDETEVQRIVEIMLNAVECRVPHTLDVDRGPSWGEIG